MSQCVYELIEVDGKRTMVAAQDLLPGSVVFQEQALMHLTHAEVQKCVGRTRPKFERYLAVYDLFNKRLTAKQQFAFLSLAKPIYPHFEVSLRSIASQTFLEGKKTPLTEEEAKLYMKLVCTERNCSFNGPAGDVTIESATRMAHSCLPNCFLDIIDDHCTCRVILPVKAGEALTIEYKPSIQTLSTADRRYHYMEFRDFTCHCPRCDAEGDDTRQFNCFDRNCNGRHYVHQPLSDRKLHYPETRYTGVEYVEPHLLPCTLCQRSPPSEYQAAMFELESRLPSLYQAIAAKHKKMQSRVLNNTAAQRSLLQEIERIKYPPWHALGLSLAITELSERQILFLQGAPEQKEKIWRLGQQIEATIGSILKYPTPFASELTSLVASGYMSTGQQARAKEQTLLGLRMHLILRGRDTHRSDLTGIMLELFRDLPLSLTRPLASNNGKSNGGGNRLAIGAAATTTSHSADKALATITTGGASDDCGVNTSPSSANRESCGDVGDGGVIDKKTAGPPVTATAEAALEDAPPTSSSSAPSAPVTAVPVAVSSDESAPPPSSSSGSAGVPMTTVMTAPPSSSSSGSRSFPSAPATAAVGAVSSVLSAPPPSSSSSGSRARRTATAVSVEEGQEDQPVSHSPHTASTAVQDDHSSEVSAIAPADAANAPTNSVNHRGSPAVVPDPVTTTSVTASTVCNPSATASTTASSLTANLTTAAVPVPSALAAVALYDTALCAYCEESPLRAALKLSYCGRCRQVAYCGPACQKAHWKSHKQRCGKT